jgi:NitT/TauT family transport system permease protein
MTATSVDVPLRRRSLRRTTVRTARRPAEVRTVDWRVVNVLRLVVLVAFLGGWQLAVSQGWIREFYVSKPSAIWTFLAANVTTLEWWRNTQVTLTETFTGLALGGVLGVVVGGVLGRLPTVDAVFEPFLTMLNALPRVALAPLMLLWFGIGTASKTALVVSIVFFIMLINTRTGVVGLDEDLATMSRTLKLSRLQTLWKVQLPNALPSIFAGLRLSVAYGLLGAVAAEMISAQRGLGQQLTFYSGSFQVDGVMGALLFLSLIAVVLNAVTLWLERRVLGWASR